MDKRNHVRLRHKAKIKLIIPDTNQEYLYEMNDFSVSGLFLLTKNSALLPGTIVKIQTTEFPDAPIQTAKVIRVADGVGIELVFLTET